MLFLQRVWSSRFLWKGELLDCAGKKGSTLLICNSLVWRASCHVSCPTDLIPSPPLITFHNVDTLHGLSGQVSTTSLWDFQDLVVCTQTIRATLHRFCARPRGSQQRHPIEPTHPLLPDGHEPRHGPRTFGTIAEWQNQPQISVVVENSFPHNS